MTEREHSQRLNLTRRELFSRTGCGLGAVALSWMLARPTRRAEAIATSRHGRSNQAPQARAQRVIYLHQSGAPSQLDLFDYKPRLQRWHGDPLPDSVRGGQRLTELTANQPALPITASKFQFARYGRSGAWLSELLPHHQAIVDDACFIRSMWTEAINHVQAASFLHTGSEQAGRPTLGAWISYGLGSTNDELPSYVVMTSKGSSLRGGESLQSRLWSNGFLPAQYQGTRFRSQGDPVLFLSNPPGINGDRRRLMLNALSELNGKSYDVFGDPEITARVEQFEMAYRMQTSIPELADLSDEPDSTYRLYGEDARQPGTFAFNCVMARRLAERDVRFIQLFHRGWDQHNSINFDLPKQAKDVDQASAALVIDLKQRGLLDDTLLVWGGEFGRTVYCQGELSRKDYGRDHHPRCFTIWLAGGGVQPGMVYGASDDHSYNVVDNPVHVHDLNATILHCLGLDHQQLTYRWQGRDFRLTDVGGNVVNAILR